MPQRQQTLQEAVGRAQWVGVPRRQALCLHSPPMLSPLPSGLPRPPSAEHG